MFCIFDFAFIKAILSVVIYLIRLKFTRLRRDFLFEICKCETIIAADLACIKDAERYFFF